MSTEVIIQQVNEIDHASRDSTVESLEEETDYTHEEALSDFVTFIKMYRSGTNTNSGTCFIHVF